MPTYLYISPSNNLNIKKTFSLMTSYIRNGRTYGNKHLRNNCSDVNKNDIHKNDNSYHTLEKLKANNPLIIVGRLDINSFRENI